MLTQLVFARGSADLTRGRPPHAGQRLRSSARDVHQLHTSRTPAVRAVHQPHAARGSSPRPSRITAIAAPAVRLLLPPRLELDVQEPGDHRLGQLACTAVTRAVIDQWRDRMKLQIINLPFCFMPGYERYLVGDLGKRERDMVFVNNESVNLAEYLAARRVRKPVCEPCPHACFCGGFYELDDVPEPPWLVRPEDLVRAIDP